MYCQYIYSLCPKNIFYNLTNYIFCLNILSKIFKIIRFKIKLRFYLPNSVHDKNKKRRFYMQILYEKEKEIMNIFWELNKPCLISDILRAKPSLSRNTVAKALVALESKGYLKVDSIRRTVTRTGRAYVPTITKEEYEKHTDLINAVSTGHSITKTTLSFFSTLLKTENIDDDFLSELETMIHDYKNGKA